jgi:hypothetical protein
MRGSPDTDADAPRAPGEEAGGDGKTRGQGGRSVRETVDRWVGLAVFVGVAVVLLAAYYGFVRNDQTLADWFVPMAASVIGVFLGGMFAYDIYLRQEEKEDARRLREKQEAARQKESEDRGAAKAHCGVLLMMIAVKLPVLRAMMRGEAVPPQWSGMTGTGSIEGFRALGLLLHAPAAAAVGVQFEVTLELILSAGANQDLARSCVAFAESMEKALTEALRLLSARDDVPLRVVGKSLTADILKTSEAAMASLRDRPT